MSRILDSQNTDIQNTEEVGLRPFSWDGYIGQEQAKKNLKVFIEASKKRDEAIDHILFFGPPGLGKTTLANIISKEMQSNIKTTSAPMIEKSGDLAALLTNLEPRDVLFIDEIHRLNLSVEEILYSVMEDYRLDIIIGSGPAAQSVKIDIPKFTLIGATTRVGMISNPLRDRFGMSFRLKFYSPKELLLIVLNASAKLKKKCDEDAALEIAKRSRGTPRIALRLLRRIRDFADVGSKECIDLKITKYGLNELGVDELGFDELDKRLIELLVDANGRPMGLNTISASISEDEGTIEDVIEPYLIANGYIERTSRGRIATDKSYKLLSKINPISSTKPTNSLF